MARPILTIADLRERARSRMPRVVFDYLDGGAEAEVTLAENRRAFDELWFRARGAIELPEVELATTVIGQRIAVPFVLAPVGSTRMFTPRGESVAARAAEAVGTTYTLSTVAGTRLEEVRAASKATLWYQLYLVGGRDVASAAIERAQAHGYSALVVTIDTPTSGLRERDVRGGIRDLVSHDPLRMAPHLWQFLTRPAWLLGYLRDGGMATFPNVRSADGTTMAYADVGVALERSVVTWEDLKWIREIWKGPILIKGVLTDEDARRSVDEGAAAIVVSNHGGRQLDGVAPALQALPAIAAAVGDRIEVLMDGGIRTGSDVVKALCLGARAVLVGRAYGYGLGAGGASGVAQALEILRSDLVRTLRLLGVGKVTELRPSHLDVPSTWRVARAGSESAKGP